jgi:hypothetical protein
MCDLPTRPLTRSEFHVLAARGWRSILFMAQHLFRDGHANPGRRIFGDGFHRAHIALVAKWGETL